MDKQLLGLSLAQHKIMNNLQAKFRLYTILKSHKTAQSTTANWHTDINLHTNSI